MEAGVPSQVIFRFWLPMAATWLMMALEGPFLAAVIARLPEASFNLAAYGVAYAFALLVEAPVIMLMSASTALVDSLHSYRRLRAFTYLSVAGVTAFQFFLLIPPVFSFVMERLLALPAEVVSLTRTALWLLLPWPGSIGYRRLYQGILIRSGRTRLVAMGTLVRLSSMAITALLLSFLLHPPGAVVGAAGLSMGVVAEAAASRLMARRALAALPTSVPPVWGGQALTLSRIAQFYFPLALTSLISLAAQPLLTFFMGRAKAPVESLAVFPVVASLTFLFRSFGLSFQEVAIALLGKDPRNVRPLTRFAAWLGVGSSAGMALVALTPLASLWFEGVSGLTPELAAFAFVPTALLVPIPFTMAILSLQRALLVTVRRTRPITVATGLELMGIAVVFPLLGWKAGLVGVTAASVSLVVGRMMANVFLFWACSRAGLSPGSGSDGRRGEPHSAPGQYRGEEEGPGGPARTPGPWPITDPYVSR